MLRLHRPARLIAAATIAAAIGCNEPTAPRRALPTQPALAASNAATMAAEASQAQLVALVQDALERLAPTMTRENREHVVPPLNALVDRLSARDAGAARQQLTTTERALDAVAKGSVDPDIESLRLHLAALRSALAESSASF